MEHLSGAPVEHIPQNQVTHVMNLSWACLFCHFSFFLFTFESSFLYKSPAGVKNHGYVLWLVGVQSVKCFSRLRFSAHLCFHRRRCPLRFALRFGLAAADTLTCESHQASNLKGVSFNIFGCTQNWCTALSEDCCNCFKSLTAGSAIEIEPFCFTEVHSSRMYRSDLPKTIKRLVFPKQQENQDMPVTKWSCFFSEPIYF